MLPKSLRLKKKDEIDYVWRKGKTLPGNFFVYKYLQNTLKFNRPCFTFSKNMKLSAVEKNRLKRQISHAYKKAISETIQTEPFQDIIIILKKIPLKDKFKTFTDDIKTYICQKNS